MGLNHRITRRKDPFRHRLSRKKKRSLYRIALHGPQKGTSKDFWFTIWGIWNMANHLRSDDPGWPSERTLPTRQEDRESR